MTIIGLQLMVLSCGEEGALKEETFSFSDENRGWAGHDQRGTSFIMTDDNGISQSFTQLEYNSYFTKSWSSLLGINTHMSHIEYTHQNWFSTFGTSFSQSLTAGIPPHGDRLYFSLGGIAFQYDLDQETIIRIDCPYGTLSQIITETGYAEGDKIGSAVDHIDSMTVGNQVYTDIILFRLDDFHSQWESFTVTEFYISKNSGLIFFKLNSGLTSRRK